MNRTFYHLAIFFTGLLIAVSIFQNVVFYQLGPQVYSLESFLPWYATIFAATLMLTLIFLRYFHFKNYKLAFYTVIAVAIASICHFVINYDAFTVKKLSGYFIYTLSLLLGTSLFFFVSLTFSQARERVWLKTAGIFGIVHTLLTLTLFVWLMTASDFETQTKVNTILNRVALAGGIIFAVFYLLNFVSELKLVPVGQPRTNFQKVFLGFMAIAALATFVSVLYTGQKISIEKHGLLRWINRGPEGALALAKPFEARTHINAKGDTLRYRLLLPLNYDPEKEYPLAICLHGGGGWGTDNVKQVEGSWMARMLSKYMNMKDYPAFVFVPQCPPGSTWGGNFPEPISDFSTIDSLVFETIEVLEEEFNIDTHRRYVMGESLGGYGTWHFVSSRPDMFAAALPICGGGNPDLADNVVDVPIWAFHGAEDKSVPVRFSREMIEAIKKAGGDPRYSEYPDKGHIISDQVFNTPGLLDWIFAQDRSETEL